MRASRHTWIGGAGGGLLDTMVYAMGEMVVEGIRSASVKAVSGVRPPPTRAGARTSTGSYLGHEGPRDERDHRWTHGRGVSHGSVTGWRILPRVRKREWRFGRGQTG